MKNEIILGFIIVLTLFLTVSAISASENMTDDSMVCMDDNSSSIVSESDLNSQGSEDNGAQDENKSTSEINARDVVSYTEYNDKFTVTLVSNGTPLENRQIHVVLNGATFNKTTDNLGRAVIDFKLKAGSYNATFYFSGDENHTSCNKTITITVKPDIITHLIVADKHINFRQGSKSVFYLRLLDVNNKPVKGQWVTVKVAGKTFKLKTNAYGYATVYLNLKKGSYNMVYSFSKNGLYLSSSGSFKIHVKSALTKGNGYWVNKWDMKKVNFRQLYIRGTKHIFLQHTAFSKYGEKAVINWIKKAHKYGMKVHIWMAVFYNDGKYIHASDKNGVYNTKRMTQIIDQAKYYASFKEVDGIHFDYVRFGGNAYKFKNSVAAINHFIKQAAISLNAKKPDIIVSAAVMPEPDSMKYYYGQDVPTMSKYLDVVIPMVYKGNYHASYKWVKKTTYKFVKQSKGAKIWTGLQTYKSDSNIKKLSYRELFIDARAAKLGKASGIVLFRWGLTPFLNFKKV